MARDLSVPYPDQYILLLMLLQNGFSWNFEDRCGFAGVMELFLTGVCRGSRCVKFRLMG